MNNMPERAQQQQLVEPTTATRLRGDDGTVTEQVREVVDQYPTVFTNLVRQAAALMDQSRRIRGSHGYMPAEAIEFASRNRRAEIPKRVKTVGQTYLELLEETEADDDKPEGEQASLSGSW